MSPPPPARRPLPGGPPLPSPPVVTVTVWGVRGRAVPAALVRMASGRRLLRRAPGLRFARLLGTGHGRGFGVTDADPRHWALLASWDDAAAADGLAGSRIASRWDAIAHERLDLRLRPLASRGRWGGQQPFDPPSADPPAPGTPVAAVTRARLRPTRAATFWRAVPPVAADLATAEGLLLALGIGEAPVGWQGTLSLWRDQAALRAFAYGGAAHREVVDRTAPSRWYAEELFARFAVEHLSGRIRGRRWP